MYSSTVIIGNVGSINDLKYTQEGAAVLSFSVAVDCGWWDKAKESYHENVEWYKVAVWRGAAERINQRIYKGRQVMVQGQIKASAWIDQNGEAKASLELTAQVIKLLGKNREGNGSDGPPDNDRPFGEPGSDDVVPPPQPVPSSVSDDPDA